LSASLEQTSSLGLRQQGAEPQLSWPSILAQLLEDIRRGDAMRWRRISSDYRLREGLALSCRDLVHAAYELADRDSLEILHRLLATIYDVDFGSPSLAQVEIETQPVLRDLAAILEHGMLAFEISLADSTALEGYPRVGTEYVNWLKRLVSCHAASLHPLYGDHLAERASSRELAFFMTQEATLDPRFDDILALLQIGMPASQKLELASNYYDEMGNGILEGMHSVMFSRTLEHLGVDPTSTGTGMLVEARAAGNLSACMALVRRHRYKALGYFGVTEYLTPRRFKHVVAAWKRNELPPAGIEYHQAHIEIDAQHAHGWMQNVIAPMIEEQPSAGREIAMGALIRLNSSQRYLDAILDRFMTDRATL